MRKIQAILSITAITLATSASVFAHRFDPTKSGGTGSAPANLEKSTSAGCAPPSSSQELNVNNVRALIHSGGDMWWDLIANARYEIPKGSGRHSLYVGNLWIGGREANTNTLKVAAQRYRNTGVDYWTGPLDTLGTAEIDNATCDLYDQLWSISRAEVEQFRLCQCLDPDDPSCEGYQIPNSIKKWPGNPIIQDGQQQYMQQILAPFYDRNGNGVYEFNDCDYPYYDLDNNVDCQSDRSALLYGDFTLWWVFNDKGNIHGESQGNQIGMEIRAQGFGFNTNDEINNMTFYNYELINRGTTTLEQCYFGVNTDADIGGGKDDYTGCDVERGFGFMYNADDYDDPYSGALGYGANPPAIGIDFFEGPYLDNNGVAEFWDNNAPPANASTIISALKDTSRWSPAFGINGLGFNDTIEDNERFGMRRFVYYNNAPGNTGDPTVATEYYNYLRGFWKDNSRMRYGGTGYPTGAFASAPEADFMFPGDSDPLHWGTKGIATSFDWAETNTGGSPNPNPADDRRFVQSAGPFTLRPGAVNDITTGVVWARASTGNSYESVLKVLAADIKAQSLFENCFKVLNGPDAPDLTIQEMDQELIMFITNSSLSNNYLDQYEELNYFIPAFGLSSTAQTRDTTIWVPAYDSVNVSGTPFYLYPTEQTPEIYDSLFVLYVGATPVDTLFGYDTLLSTQVTTNIQIGTIIDTSFYDRQIRFEGYMIYQLKDKTVTATDIFGEDGSNKARLVAQCDIRNFDALGNPIARIINFEYDDNLGYSVPVVKVDGGNTGIKHSFKVTQDLFTTTTSKTLVNHKTYYYMALSYGYNNYKNFNPNDALSLDGQKEPFFLGRRNIKVYPASPHIPAAENGGTILNSLYGFGPQITRLEGRGNGGNILEITKETEDAILASPTNRTDKLVYENGLGPIKVKIIDPLSITGKRYIVKILDTNAATIKTVRSTATWVLLDPDEVIGGDDTVAISQGNLSAAYEQIIYDRRKTGAEAFLGFSVTINQVTDPGPTYTTNSCLLIPSYTPPGIVEVNGAELTTPGNGLLYSSIVYEKPNNVYLGFFPDVDGSSPLNWARNGTVFDDLSSYFNSNHYAITLCATDNKLYFDPEGKYVSGTSFYGGGGMVPYVLTSSVNAYKTDPTSTVFLPGHNIGYINQINAAGRIAQVVGAPVSGYIGSIDLVFTSDKSKWTRCPVIETYNNIGGQTNNAYVEPGFPIATPPKNLDLRFSFSVDKNGNKNSATSASTNPEDANYISPYGMGWFPGYAIDLETGERLNMAFGEDSYLVGENGRDMKFNPSEADPSTTGEGYVSDFGDYLFAGKHYIYIFNSNGANAPYKAYPNYDAGRSTMTWLADSTTFVPVSGVSTANARQVWRNCIWTGIPFHVKNKTWLDGEIRIKLRVQRSYMKDYSATSTEGAPQNANNPMYEFTFDGLATETQNTSAARSALDLIQVVPNPYYAASEYETSALDNRVKIVNLPDKCTISIYTLNGTLIRTFVKDNNNSTNVEWDLKNFKNIPIATGLYIIHVKADGIGERILKWYGVTRPIQLDNF